MEQILKIYRQAFNLRHSEAETVLYFQFIFFVLLFSLLMVKSTASALFVAEYSAAELPRAYIIIAIIAGGITQMVAWMNRFPITQVIKWTIVMCAGIFVILGLLISLRIFSWSTYLLYIWVALFALVSTSQFWLLANMIFNADQAKRVFGFIGSGAIAGAALGGYISSGISILGGAEFVALIVGGLLIICIPLSNRIIAINNVKTIQYLQPISKSNEGFLAPLRLIKNDKLLISMTLLVFGNVLVSKIIDYHFGLFASQNYTTEDELSAFYGFTYSSFNIIGFVLQLFISSKIVKRIGVSNMMLILPVAILINFVGLLALPSLLFAILLKLSDTSLKQSFQRLSFELLYLPVPPYIKGRTKPFIDVFVDSLATGISGILLITITTLFLLPGWITITLGLMATSIWLWWSIKSKKTYLQSVIQNNSSHLSPLTPDELEADLENAVKGQNLKKAVSLLQAPIQYDNLDIDTAIQWIYDQGDMEDKMTVLDFCYLNPFIQLDIDFHNTILLSDNPAFLHKACKYAVISDKYSDATIYPLVNDTNWATGLCALAALIHYYGRTPYLEKSVHAKATLLKYYQLAKSHPNEYLLNICMESMARYGVDTFDQWLQNPQHVDHPLSLKYLFRHSHHAKNPTYISYMLAYYHQHPRKQEILKGLAAFDDSLCNFIEIKLPFLSIKEISILIKAIALQKSEQAGLILLGLIHHPQIEVSIRAAEALERFIKVNPHLPHFQTTVTNKINQEINKTRHIHLLRSALPNNALPTNEISEQDTNYWLKIRLSELLDYQKMLLLHLSSLVTDIKDFDQFVKIQKASKSGTRHFIEALQELSLPSKINLKSSHPWEYEKAPNRRKLLAQIRALQDDQINQLLD